MGFLYPRAELFSRRDTSHALPHAPKYAVRCLDVFPYFALVHVEAIHQELYVPATNACIGCEIVAKRPGHRAMFLPKMPESLLAFFPEGEDLVFDSA